MRFFEFADWDLLEAPLGTTGLFKYQGTKKDRIPILLKKIKDQSPFKIRTKTGIEDFIVDPAEYDKVQAWTSNPSNKLTLKSRDDERIIPFGSIIKTKEFGGEEAGYREKIEQSQIGEIQQQLESAKEGQPSVMLKVGDKVVQAASVEKEKGSVGGRAPKSDMTVLDEQGKPVAWVSLKGRPFRWGGWQHLMKLPEIVSWFERIKEVTGNEFDHGQSFGLHISDEIKQKIIYGKDFGGKRGFSNVDAVLIGDPVIKSSSQGFELSAGTMYINGDIPSGGDEPYLVLRYMTGRNDVGFKNARAETNTRSEGRKVKWLDNNDDVVDAKKEPSPQNV